MIGRTRSHYRIVELAGEGGMGVRYRARDVRLGRDASLAVVRSTVGADQGFAQVDPRFARAGIQYAGPSRTAFMNSSSVASA